MTEGHLLAGSWDGPYPAASEGALFSLHLQIRPSSSRDFQIHCFVGETGQPVRADWADVARRRRVRGRRDSITRFTSSLPRLSVPAFVLGLIESSRVGHRTRDPSQITQVACMAPDFPRPSVTPLLSCVQVGRERPVRSTAKGVSLNIDRYAPIERIRATTCNIAALLRL